MMSCSPCQNGAADTADFISFMAIVAMLIKPTPV